MRKLGEERALGVFVAVCRETFEEVGLLLARGADGRLCAPALAERLQAGRKAMLAAPGAFARMLVEHQLTIDAEALGVLGALDHALGGAETLRTPISSSCPCRPARACTSTPRRRRNGSGWNRAAALEAHQRQEFPWRRRRC